jgi:hypothetical protein
MKHNYTFSAKCIVFLTLKKVMYAVTTDFFMQVKGHIYVKI